MYITITQSEYRKYSKEFKKTFLGKSRYRDYLWCSILGTYFTLILSLEFIIGIIKQVDVKLDFNNVIFILLTIIFLSLTLITRITYDKHLKEYIEYKKNK